MALEKSIIKSAAAEKSTFEYKPRELGGQPSEVARNFVDVDAFRSSDFKISDLIAQQAGISQLEDDAQQGKINAVVLERLKEVEERAFEEGYELGLIEGTEKAFQEAKADLLAKLTMFENVLLRVEELKKQLLIDNEAALIQLVFHTAKKMALRELKDNREAVLEILQHVVGEIQDNETVNVRLSSEDLLFIEGLQERGGQNIENLKRVKFLPDDKMTSGGCFIETQFGSVDASVEERVERTWQTLLARTPQKTPDQKE
jgi:flagellar assembly protein FliH